ncbi:MAG TPA: nuclear transport factor 2 family protein, partial [Acidimicrobiia bacterium]|nr:nuclear transport factor 2 family protein [Acidimicrobiia bacterium]
DGRGHFEDENIATRGRTLALTRTTLRIPDPEATGIVLIATEVDAEGLFLRSTVFDSDDVDGALASLDEMFLAGEGAQCADVLRIGDSLLAALVQHDIEAMRLLLAPDCVMADHRRIAFPMSTVDEWLDGIAETFVMWGHGAVRVEHITDLGPHGALWACVSTGTELTTGGAYEVPWLLSLHIDDGLITSHRIYSEDDIDAARRERSTAVENAASRADVRLRNACMRRDWDAFIDVVTPDFISDDRRLQERYEGDRALAVYRTIHALDQFNWETTLLASRGETLALGRDRVTFVDGAVGPAEVEALSLVECDADGRVVSVTAFNVDDLDAAYDELDARFVALTATTREDRFGNLAWRTAVRFRDASNARDRDQFAGLFAQQFELDDRRWAMVDRTPRSIMKIFDFDEYRIERGLVATRGDLLALVAEHVMLRDGASGSAEIECRTLIETDTEGRIVRHTVFENEDDSRAVDALDARYVELGGLDARAPRDAFNARDWERYATFLPEDGAMDDRRTAGYGQLDRDGFVSYERAILEMAPDVKLRIDHVVGDSSTASLTVGAVTGTHDGGTFEMPFVTLGQTTTDGRPIATTLFDIDDFEVAKAEYERLTQPPVVDLHENAATRAAARHTAISNAQDWDAFVAAVSPDFSFHDRRLGLALDSAGEEAHSNIRMMFDLDELRHEHKVVATRGDSLALLQTHTTFRDGEAGPAEIECLAIAEVDTQGRLCTEFLFDAGDLVGAFNELDARHAVNGGNLATRAAEMQAAGVTTGNWEAYLGTLAADAVVDDRRSGVAVFARGDEALASVHRVGFTLDRCRIDRELNATFVRK